MVSRPMRAAFRVRSRLPLTSAASARGSVALAPKGALLDGFVPLRPQGRRSVVQRTAAPACHPWARHAPVLWPASPRPSRTWGCYARRWRLRGGGRMRWRIMLELAGPDGPPQRHEVSSGERLPTGRTAATLGLSLEEGKAVLAAVQRHLVTVQVDEHCHSRRRCDRCGAQRPLKGRRPRRLISLFGVVEVRAPRFGPCRCGVACRRSVTPVAEIMPDRCTPEYERVVAAMGAALPYRRALALLA